MSQFLQGTDDCAQSWVIHGLTVQSAMQIGLYMEQSSPNCSLMEQESRKRTWHACVIIDGYVSYTVFANILKADS